MVTFTVDARGEMAVELVLEGEALTLSIGAPDFQCFNGAEAEVDAEELYAALGKLLQREDQRVAALQCGECRAMMSDMGRDD